MASGGDALAVVHRLLIAWLLYVPSTGSRSVGSRRGSMRAQ